ncbi:MAG: hypothetical protein P4M12_04830 [Gammaproteobacteria bacterium]|nr:hypothetical protein [Gammaproteobacteria bacterium]
MKKFCWFVHILFLLLISNICFANSGELFNVGATANILQINTTVPNHTYSSAGIKINTPGYSLTNSGVECAQAGNGYCLFSVSNSASKLLSISGPAGAMSISLCLNAKGPLSCQNFSGSTNFTNYGYVSDVNANQIFKCTINSTGGFENCVDSGNTGIPISVPLGIALNSSFNRAYIVLTNNNQVLQCPIDSNGNLGNCIDSGNTGIDFNHPISLAFNKLNTLAYVTDQNANSVSVCPITAGGSFGNCRDSGNTGAAFDAPVGIFINSSGNFAYITNQGGSNNVFKCPILANGNFGACSNANVSGFVFTKPDNLVLNTANSIAYITDSSLQKVYQCTVNGNGEFTSCKDTGNALASIAANIVLNKFENTAYIGNGSGGVVKCPIDASGNLGICAQTGGSGFTFPLYLALAERTSSFS